MQCNWSGFYLSRLSSSLVPTLRGRRLRAGRQTLVRQVTSSRFRPAEGDSSERSPTNCTLLDKHAWLFPFHHFRTPESNGLQSMLSTWVPHDLSPDQQSQRLDICMSLLSKKRNFMWLDHLITGDEKWVLYVNSTRKRQ